MFDGCSKGILGEVNSSNVGVVGQGIDDRLDRKSGGRCWSDRRHEEDGLDGWFKFLSSEGMVRGEGRMMMPGVPRRIPNMWPSMCKYCMALSIGQHAYNGTCHDLDLTI